MENSHPESGYNHPPKPERTWAMFSHLSALTIFLGIPFANILGPFVMWLVKKDEMPFAADQAKEALNFQISMTIYFLVALLSIFVVIGFVLVPAVVLFDFILIIIATTRANDGIFYRYPLTLRFVK